MNEDSGTAFDSTEHGLDALPDSGVNGDVGQMVVYENGACGRARVNGHVKTKGGNYLRVSSYDALSMGGYFVISGWFMGEGYVVGETVSRLLSRKNTHDDIGWEISCYPYNSTGLSGGIAGSANDKVVRFVSEIMPNVWTKVSVAFNADTLAVYTNGVFANSGVIDAAQDNGLCLAIGRSLLDGVPSFCGQYDEIRLRGGTLSADRIKADYDMIAKRDFCTYGKVEGGGAGK